MMAPPFSGGPCWGTIMLTGIAPAAHVEGLPVLRVKEGDLLSIYDGWLLRVSAPGAPARAHSAEKM